MQREEEKTDRLTASPWTLLRRTAGSRQQMSQKFWRLIQTLYRYVDHRMVNQRLKRLKEQGVIAEVPTVLQRVVGVADMFRHFIVPAARDYYRSKGLNFAFHTLLRVLDDPSSMADPCGLRSDRDVIIGHLMQVVHANPDYDLQLLCAIEGGLEELERQLTEMIAGTHPRTASIRSTVEDPKYHERLLTHVREFMRSGGHASPLLRENVAGNQAFSRVEQIFGELPTTMAYFCRLPNTPLAAMKHLLRGRLAE